MVTRTTDIDHPDRNCVSRVCDKCGKVFFRCHHESPAYLDRVRDLQDRQVEIINNTGQADLCRKCKEEKPE